MTRHDRTKPRKARRITTESRSHGEDRSNAEIAKHAEQSAHKCSAGRPALQADERSRIGTMREPHRTRTRFAHRPDSGCAAAPRRPPNTAGAPPCLRGLFLLREQLSLSSMHDVIVVGAGHNGLIAAALLAKRGLKTLVLERTDRLGGCARSGEIAPGFLCL